MPLLLALCLLQGPQALAQGGRKAPEGPLRVISWSSPTGAQSITFETLYGLKAFQNFLNANGGVGGRQLELHSVEMDDAAVDFVYKLDTLVIQGKPDLVVGGASGIRAAETAEYFRRILMPWFGPWTDDPKIYLKRDDDPVGLLPSAPAELEMLFKFVQSRKAEGQGVFFVYTDGSKASQDLASLARAKARAHEVELSMVPLPPSFSEWKSLEAKLTDGSFIILWTNPGPSAIIKRLLGPAFPDAVWLTNSLNSPDHEIMMMSVGNWEGTIFPSVLIPSNQISEAYWTVLVKYGLPGLNPDYQSFLGFGQGQVLARAMANATGSASGSLQSALQRSLQSEDISGSLLSGTRLPHDPDDPGGAYLATVLPKGAWAPVE
ncbi:MAG: ABC transporter substrate-binding protein [Deltaproteobacteria bacterium]|jgi:hypothetical protein|nr:ABC transporter substrate-binding protein [Deltaproteobacteria bacterium]